MLQLLEVGKPDRDERAHFVLEPCRCRRRERGLVALAHLVERHALLQPVVPRDEKMLNLGAGILLSGHEAEE